MQTKSALPSGLRLQPPTPEQLKDLFKKEDPAEHERQEAIGLGSPAREGRGWCTGGRVRHFFTLLAVRQE